MTAAAPRRIDRAPARALGVAAVVALHLALLWLLIESSTTRAGREMRAAPLARIAVRLIAPSPPAAPKPAGAESPARVPGPKPMQPTAQANRAKTTPRPSAEAAITVPQREAAIQPAPAASTTPGTPSLIDTEATRRAIRASARAPSLGDQLARAREEPDRASPQERLSNGVKSAGKGDCLKGEFAGGGMGLLSAPFLLIAAARGDCAK